MRLLRIQLLRLLTSRGDASTDSATREGDSDDLCYWSNRPFTSHFLYRIYCTPRIYEMDPVYARATLVRPSQNCKVKENRPDLSRSEQPITGIKECSSQHHQSFTETADLSNARFVFSSFPTFSLGWQQLDPGASPFLEGRHSLQLSKNYGSWTTTTTSSPSGSQRD